MKVWMKRLTCAAAAAGICVLTVLLSYRGSGTEQVLESEEKTAGSVTIGFSETDSSNPWRVAQQTSLINAAADRGFRLLLKETGTRLILMECSTWEVNPDDYLFMICTDYYKEGQLCAQILHSRYQEESVRILEVVGEEGSTVARQRAAGFRDGILKYPHMKISGQIVGSFDRVTAQKSMEEMLAGEAYDYNAIVAYSDEDGLGVLQALKVAGKADGSVPIISINGVQDALKAIIAGEYYATVESNPEVGPLVMQLIGSNEKGYAPAKQVFIPYNIFDRDNVFEQYKNAY